MPGPLPALFALTLAAAAPASPGPTLAKEDTLHTSVPEVLVRAPRVTLDEILDRVARGEARRESLLTDQAFTATVRVITSALSPKPLLFEESVYRIYRKRPNHARTILLRRHKSEPARKKNVNIDVDFEPGMDEEVINFAFQPAARRDYRYRIEGRDIVGGHVIYRIRFEPRSALDAFAPSGLVWIDTNDFVIVREEVHFERSPVPLLLKDIDRMVVERQRVGEHWVLKRVLMRAQFTIPMPKVGRAMDFSVLYDDYALNTGLADSLFQAAGRR